MARCADCTYWHRMDGASEGICGYTAPPVVAAIFDMLHAEPTTHINWRVRLAEPFLTEEVYVCSEHKPKT